MSATSVGEIGLDLVVNKKQFEKQMLGIGSLAKKTGAALAGAFAVKKLIDFGKSCLDLGSDLQEVQNVVDVTFPKMTAQIDDFAQAAAQKFGLSETMAKRFSGTFGSMAKAFGFTEKEAYSMGTALTGLAGDVASFYNITQDEAYTKLKSVFTGETESLKDLGVVMTQSALDAYALANGFGKTTRAMTEAEKVALRYSFVQEQLSAATGDFVRTSGSWANQCRILSLQVQSIMATVGQGLINLFTPVIKIVNIIIGKIATLANAFKAFTELLTGNKNSGSKTQIADVAEASTAAATGLSNASDAAKDTASSAKKAGNAAKKAADQIRSLMGFDKINKLDSTVTSSDNSGDAGAGTGAGSALGSAVDFGSLAEGETVLDKTDERLQALINRGKELADIFKNGFEIGFGNSEEKIKNIGNGLRNILQTTKEILLDRSVTDAANSWAEAVALSLGEITGSAASIGLSVADNLIGGIDGYLQENGGFIKDQIVSMLDASGRIAGLQGKFSVAIAKLFDIFSGDRAKKITADLIALFANGYLGAKTLGIQFVADIAQLVVAPITENIDDIKTAFEGILTPIGIVLETLRNSMTETFLSIRGVYDTYIKPLVQSLTEGITSIVETVLEAWNVHIAPTLESLAEKIATIWEEDIQPVIDKVIELIGQICELIRVLWEEVIQPVIKEFIKTSAPKISKTLESIGTWVGGLVTTIAKAAEGILTALGGVIQFFTGVFSQDWETTTAGLQAVAEGFLLIATAVFTYVKDFLLKPLDEFLCNVFAVDWSEQFGILGEAANAFFDVFEPIWTSVKTLLEGVITFLEDVFLADWDQAWEDCVSAFKTIFDGIVTIVKTPINGVIALLNGLIGAINSLLAIIENKLKFNFTIPNPFGGTIVDYHWEAKLPRIKYTIPALASGGFVEANTPQLALIGDNRHQGEVVAPEDKLREMAMEAVRAAGVGGITREELESIINKAVLRIVSALASMGFYVDGEELAKAMQTSAQSMDGRFNPVIPT